MLIDALLLFLADTPLNKNSATKKAKRRVEGLTFYNFIIIEFSQIAYRAL